MIQNYNNKRYHAPVQAGSIKKYFILNRWQDYYFKLDTASSLHLQNRGLVTPLKISLAFETFKEKLFSEFIEDKSNIKLLILFKIKTKNNQIRSISYMQTINLEDIDQLKQLFIEFWNLRSEDYYLAQISDIVFTYKIVNLNLPIKILKINELGKQYNSSFKNKLEKSEINKMTFSGYNFPANMDITSWGNYHFISDNKAIIYKKGSHLEYHVELFDNYQKVELKLNNKILLNFKDTMNDKSNLNTFTRTINNQEFIFEDGELLIKKIKKKVSFLSKVKRNMSNSKNFITMDLETRIINEIMSSYCVSIYDGKEFKSFYLTDYSSEKDMLRASITNLMKRKYHNYRIYLHNFSKFDAVFLLTVMTDLSDQVKPIMRNGQFIDLRFKFAKKYNLFFRDSLLLLPSSLKSLAKNFNVDNKGIFPYRFVNNQNIQLNYKGLVPEFNIFDGLTLDEYNKYSSEFTPELGQEINNSWDLKKETIKYCELDCYILYKIIDKFSDNIFNLFRIDLLQYPTLSSLAFGIYRSQFLNNAKIPIIQGEMYNFIKKSYTGGSVDVYKPIPTNNSKIYRYDVNSLYPFVMKNYSMPCGTPIYFEGDILKSLNGGEKPFGIFEVDIEAPADIKIPLLQTRVKLNNDTFRTIAPIGTWTGNYFSDELYNASNYGYKFKIKRGYLFERGNIFTGYVDYLYDLKKNSEKGSPNYIISKLLLNSLYGRLGMSPITEQHKILTNKEAIKLYSKIDVTNILDLKNGKELISFFNSSNEYDNSENNDFDIKNISVVVSSVVTASARIFMSQFKTDKRFTIYYSDTDSIDVDKELDSKYIGNKLGQMKLEHIFDDVVFLAPKMYGGINKNYEYVRIKGLKNPIEFKDLKTLLLKDSKLEIKQEKWYKDISNGQFHIKDEIYTLIVTDNKRKLIYNSDNLFYDTAPLKLDNRNITE